MTIWVTRLNDLTDTSGVNVATFVCFGSSPFALFQLVTKYKDYLHPNIWMSDLGSSAGFKTPIMIGGFKSSKSVVKFDAFWPLKAVKFVFLTKDFAQSVLNSS